MTLANSTEILILHELGTGKKILDQNYLSSMFAITQPVADACGFTNFILFEDLKGDTEYSGE